MATPPPPPTMPDGARCAHHPERAAEVVCARCGSFVCAGCRVGDTLCVPCKQRLLKQGVPWTPQEKDRSSARSLRDRAELALRVEMGVAAAGALIMMGASNGFLPQFLRPAGQACWALACAIGLVVAVAAGVAWRRSETGRPGPNVRGVVHWGHAALLGGLGLVPVVLSATLLFGR